VEVHRGGNQDGVDCISGNAFQSVAFQPVFALQLKNYENLKTLMDRWIDLATELSNLQLRRDRT
jgi:hypothetical protein